MSESVSISIRSSILDRDRYLIINPEFIQFDNTELKDAKPIKIPKSGISGFRFGVKPIRGYMFYIGSIFCIDVRGVNEQVIKLRLKSLYSIGRKELAEKYSSIIKARNGCLTKKPRTPRVFGRWELPEVEKHLVCLVDEWSRTFRRNIPRVYL